MTFALYLGSKADASSWLELARRFGAWAGLVTHVEHALARDQRRACLVTMRHPAGSGPTTRADQRLMLVRSRGAPGAWPDDPVAAVREIEQPPSENALRAVVLLESGEVLASVPIATPEHLYYLEDEHGLALANDLRLMAAWSGARLRPAALFALFQYGMIPAPYSLFEQVARVPPGHTLKFRPGSASAVSPLPGPADGSHREKCGHDSETLFLNALDSILTQVPDAAVLYFSGGVDSSLLASRLIALERSDIMAVNFAFGRDDGEGRFALEMASRLGLRCEQVLFEPDQLGPLLERIGRDYSYPFGDDSTIPTNLLVHGALKMLGPGRTVLEGTGADGGFGPVVPHPERWNRLYRLPRGVRQGLGAIYRWLRLWHNTSLPRTAVLAGLARQSVRVPLEVAAVPGSNPLDGIAFRIPQRIREELNEALLAPIAQWGAPLSPRERFALLDLIHVCANRFAAKSFDPLRLAGMDPVYPYLEPTLLRASFALPWEEKARGAEGKVLLKRLLAHQVPRDWIYRRKRAFDAPLAAVLGHPAVQASLRTEVLSPRNPLLDFADVRVVSRLVERSQRFLPLRTSVQRFLWTVLFASSWLAQLPRHQRR